MAGDGKKTWLWVGILVAAISSCCCVGGIGAFFYVGARDAADIPYPDQVATRPPTPAGWNEYVHTANCIVLNPNLALSTFRVSYPPHLRTETCAQQAVAASYVTFLEESGGYVTGQFGLGYVRGPESMMPSLLDQLAADFQRQMPPGSTFTPHDSSPLAARGTTLTRKDYVVNVTGDFGGFAAGTYAYRFVTIRQTMSDQDLLATIITRVTTTPEAAFQSMNGDYATMLESIAF